MPTRADVHKAAEALRADPRYGGTKIEQQREFLPRDKAKDEPTPDASKWAWLSDAMRSFAEFSRWLVFGLGAFVVAWLAIRIHRWVRVHGVLEPKGRADLPSHVHSLDIRPESLPADVGAAAAALWAQGDQPAALSMLYRGALSRLVHAHAVPIRAASTEGECAALARLTLPGPTYAFVARVISAWQTAIYGARMPTAAEVAALCAEFAAALPATLIASAPPSALGAFGPRGRGQPVAPASSEAGS